VNELARQIVDEIGKEGLTDVVATVSAVNPDNTVNINLRGAIVPALPAFRSYSHRAIGDRVLVRVMGSQMIVLGAVGAPADTELPPQIAVTVSDAAPVGGDWQAISATWMIPATATAPPQIWGQRTAPYVPPAPTAPNPATLTVSATAIDTFRAGGRLNKGNAEQGDYTGRGLCTGVFIFGAVWGALSGKTITNTRITMRRANTGGFTYGGVPVTIWTHNQTTMPSSTPTLGIWAQPGALQINAEVTFTLGPGFGQMLRDGTAAGFAIFTNDARQNLETQGGCTVAVDYY
jgi:hypothetical protein